MWYDLDCHIISLHVLLLDCYVFPSLNKVIVIIIISVGDDKLTMILSFSAQFISFKN